VLSRIAENLFWMGRYVERMENTSRLLDVNYHAMLETTAVLEAQWEPLLEITHTQEGYAKHFSSVEAYPVALWLASHEGNPSSVLSSLTYARENARSLRDRISTEMWESLNSAYLDLRSRGTLLDEGSLHRFCNSSRDASHLFFGIAEATLPRDQGWYFLKAGRLLERADNVARLLATFYVTYRSGPNAALILTHHYWTGVLKSVSAFEAYLKEYQGALEAHNIAEFLILSESFPRSVAYSLGSLQSCLEHIAEDSPEVEQGVLRELGWLRAQLEYAQNVTEILEGKRITLKGVLESLGEVSASIKRTYFAARG